MPDKIPSMIEIVVDSASLHQSGSGGILGSIYIRSQKGAFPEEAWSDFPVVLLAWWINGLSDFVAGRAYSFEGRFMDGPFTFVVESDFIRWKEGGDEISTEVIDIQSMYQSAISTGKTVALTCRQNNWKGSDVDELERAVSQALA